MSLHTPLVADQQQRLFVYKIPEWYPIGVFNICCIIFSLPWLVNNGRSRAIDDGSIEC